uniref:RAN binding protein 10 n=2 Tax=Salmo TaxID=8028 RepID=A0A674BC71_SALTR|nr:Ran-binding protein 10 [Salmo salar]|eukprot:NP_001140098.1 Ran-binding protein 10 [Salmo salar]
MAELGAGSMLLGDPAFNYQEHELNERLKRLYPAVNEEETPLPRSWSPKDKYSYIGLSQNNLRVHYKAGRIDILLCLHSFPGNHNSRNAVIQNQLSQGKEGGMYYEDRPNILLRRKAPGSPLQRGHP